MHDLPLPTFPIADLGAPRAPRSSLRPSVSAARPAPLWTWFAHVMKTMFAGHSAGGPAHPPARCEQP